MRPHSCLYPSPTPAPLLGLLKIVSFVCSSFSFCVNFRICDNKFRYWYSVNIGRILSLFYI
jgi:uncharacterized membrane protein